MLAIAGGIMDPNYCEDVRGKMDALSSKAMKLEQDARDMTMDDPACTSRRACAWAVANLEMHAGLARREQRVLAREALNAGCELP